MRDARRRSIRFRATAAVVVIALVLGGAGSVAFIAVLEHSLVDGVQNNAETSLETLAGRVEAEGDSVVDAHDDDILVQLQDDDGAVVAHGDDAGGAPLPQHDGSIVTRDDERWLLVSDDLDEIGGSDREAVLVVGGSLDDADDAVATVRSLLLGALPILVVLMGVLAWIVVGRALRPVERMRVDAESVRATNLHARIDEPGTGDEIDRLARTLNGMLARLEDSQRAQQQFVSDASHELRSPLATIRQHAELARLHPQTTSLAELSDVVLSESDRQNDLVESLLVLTRLDENGPGSLAPVDLDDLLLAQAARVRALGGVVVTTTGIGPARVSGDERLLTTLIRNLVDNAARHAEHTVDLHLSSTDAAVTLAVDDDGPGIAPADRERVFDRFVRLDEGRDRDSGGSGLGLAIARAVARAHGGTISVTSAESGGASFAVTLPAAA
ncbi:two-component sensor histidine kinase [Frondihabitans sucicola]|uniref:histidine kinase n=1 Tax=Frondihabitans sucicola TaxID=1268041 RepID=A0ABM8GUV7_9MICO|nr:HAMP domain-containing sensor histidine kinase [Frondihabitans sucicola]BDZ47779.1 two-component sensor histidine kinase [Frondihabitans sucicola]BDZ52252.1 two-component sensor histidine kinase [Frondihabitans sucicola]